MAYLLIIIVVALLGIAKITLQQRREHKLHVQNDYRTSLEKVATQPLARADDGPRRRWELAGFSERKKAREDRMAERPRRSESLRGRKNRSEERGMARRQERRPAAKRTNARAPKNESARRHRTRSVASRYENDVDWFEDLRSQPSDISLDHDLAPTRLPVNSRRAAQQPSTRGRLQTQVHANIHPAHLPPNADGDVDFRPSRIHASA